MSSSSEHFEEHWLTGPSDTKFHVRTYAPQPPHTKPKAIVVFLHGFIEHIARYEHVFPIWASRGFAVFAFDQRGFGKTSQDAENKSPHSEYAKTNDQDQMRDVEWAIVTARKYFKGDELGIPLFLYGHSMGGAIALSSVTRTKGAPSKETIDMVSGVIATSPLFKQAKPANSLLRWAGGKAAVITPHTTFPAPVKAEDLSHDPDVGTAYLADPLVKHCGTLRAITDMLNRGDALLSTQHKTWPTELPVLILHGSEDKVTAPVSSQHFIDKLPAKDKTLTYFPGGYHELHNEPDGVKETLVETCITWVEMRLPENASSSSKL